MGVQVYIFRIDEFEEREAWMKFRSKVDRLFDSQELKLRGKLNYLSQ